MKAILLAVIFSALYLVAVTVGFRVSRPDLRARFMLWLFFFFAILGPVAHILTPATLWVLPSDWAEPRAIVDLSFFLFLFSAAFFGGILQLYNLADRGFSLRIAIEIDEAPDGMTTGGIMTAYSEGRGIHWMYQKRLDDMTRLGLITVKDNVVFATPAGRRVAARFVWLRRFLRVEG